MRNTPRHGPRIASRSGDDGPVTNQLIPGVDAVHAVRVELSTLHTVQERATFLKELTYLFYDHSKFRVPGGEGMDGMDGPERRSLGKVVAAVEDHWLAAEHRWRRVDHAAQFSVNPNPGVSPRRCGNPGG
jgi:hypothetical protein